MALARPSSADPRVSSCLRTFSILSAQDPSPTISATSSHWAPYPTPHSHVCFRVPVRLPSTPVCLNAFTSLHRRARPEPGSDAFDVARKPSTVGAPLPGFTPRAIRPHLLSRCTPSGCNATLSATVEAESNGSPNPCRCDPERGAPVIRLPRT